MATLNTTITTTLVPNLSIFSEDAARDGFTNLGSASDSATFNRTIIFNGQVFEDTRSYLVNGQFGNDTITTAAGDDVVYGGSGADTISTGKGNDKLYGGSGADKLSGGADNDYLEGGSGNDVLDGGSGGDYLIGGTGNDTITSGSGNDFIALTVGSGTDLITDFTHGQDKIRLGNDILGQLPDTYRGAIDIASALVNINPTDGSASLIPSSALSNPVLIFDAATQVLSFDADGLAGAGAAVELAKFAGVSELNGADFYNYWPF